MSGFIKIHRALIGWEWFDDSQVVHVFITILLNANHTDGMWRGIKVKKGQWITGRKKLSGITNIPEQTIRTILKKLERSEITIESTNRFSLITVINWDTYQITKDKTTSKSPTDGQQLTTNKNEKKEECVDIINHLNRKTGKAYKPTTKATKESINARMAEGYTVEDFITAIDNQCFCWQRTDMEQYLTPATLFQPSKFEKYLQNTPPKARPVY